MDILQTCRRSVFVDNITEKCSRPIILALVIFLLTGLFIMAALSGRGYTAFTSSGQMTGGHFSAAHAFNSRYQFAQAEKRLPQCIIIGVRKAGTRALIDFLSIHPDIVAAKHEQHFFSNSHNYNRGLKHYIKQMPLSVPGQITMEKTPAYFHSPSAASRIQFMNDSIKLLVIVREPVSRAVSEYVQFDYLRGRTQPFEYYAFDMKRRYKEGDSVIYHSGDSVSEDNPRIRLSKYYLYTKRWLKYFKRKQIHFVNGDILLKDPASELQKVETFLGLSHNITKDNFFFSKEKHFFCWRKWDKTEACLKDGKGRPHPKLNERYEKALTNYFRPYNKKFFDLIGQDFGWPT